ncbi:MAG: hypothetical protein DBX38_07785 [Eubacteriales Family XIII. Incertae Sedis bacterium]|nr:MAG: hypothetical protein DBX38_07785 [Clostridiales Family XIII bacterium]
MRMQEKFKISPELKDMLMRALVCAVVIAVGFLAVDAFTQGRDGRRQIVDDDGASETALIEILSDIKGAGDVDVMVKYDDGGGVTGVIVTASGAGSVVVRNNLTNAVSAVFNIPVSNVMVFEKENGGESDEQ